MPVTNVSTRAPGAGLPGTVDGSRPVHTGGGRPEVADGGRPEVAGARDSGTGVGHPAVDAPGLSVVIPVRGRVAQLEALLGSLAGAVARCPEPVEVLVVDDSEPEQAERHRANCARHGARYLRGPRHVGAKRNLGACQSRYDLLLFVDSDCAADPDLLRTHVACLRAAPADVAGVAGPTVVERSDARLFRVMSRSDLLNGDLERPMVAAEVSWATTSNLAMRKRSFFAVGGFVEESLTVVSGEDVDLGLRLTAAGHRLRCDQGARVVHSPDSTASLRTVCRRLYGYGRSEQWLVTVHPGHRYRRLNPVSALAATVLCCLAAAPLTGGASALLVPLVAVALLGWNAWRRRPAGGREPVADAIVRTSIEFCFDLGAAVAALQLRRPGLLFAGFRLAPPDGAGGTVPAGRCRRGKG